MMAIWWDLNKEYIARKVMIKNKVIQIRLWYQPGRSKQIMKESKYRLNGKTHKKGMTAISRQTWLVTANNKLDPEADKRIQNNLFFITFSWCSLFTTLTSLLFLNLSIAIMQKLAEKLKTKKDADHNHVCVLNLKTGSNTNGYETRASNEAVFDRAYSG